MAFGVPVLTKKKKVQPGLATAFDPPEKQQIVGAPTLAAPSPPKATMPTGPAVPPVPPAAPIGEKPKGAPGGGTGSTVLTPDVGVDPTIGAGLKAGQDLGKELDEPIDGPVVQEDLGAPKLEENKKKQENKQKQAEQETMSDFEKAVGDLLLGQVNDARKGADTTQEEELIRQQMEDALASQLRGSRARAGRSGFASGGAQQALEGDLMRAARQQGLEDVLGLRRTEDQRGIDNAQQAIGSDIDMRKQKEDEFFNEKILQTLQSMLGIDDGGEDPGGGGGGGGITPLDGSLPDIPGAIEDAVNQNPAELAASNSPIKDGDPGTMENPKTLDKAPAGAVRGAGFRDGTFMYTLRHDEDGGWTEYFRAP